MSGTAFPRVYDRKEKGVNEDRMPFDRQVPLKNVVGMDYEPRNEAGVIILFSIVMKQLGFSGIVEAQGKFPDCIARRQGKKVMIEFEYDSKNFITHNHLKELGRRKCTVVCWEDNWQKPPSRVSIISLSKELGLSNRVRLSHAQDKENLRFLDTTRAKTCNWSMPAKTKKRDLLLVWRSGPKQSRFHDIFEALENAVPKHGYSGYGRCKIISHLENPVTLQDIKNHNVLGKLSIKESQFFMGSNTDLTPYWPWLYQIIIDRNPKLKKVLSPFSP